MDIFERQELNARRPITRNGTELDATEHADVLVWNHGKRAEIKRMMRRRDRRQARQLIRMAY